MTDTKKLKDQIQQDIQKVMRKINVERNYYEDLQSQYDADSEELAVLENQLNSEEEFLKMLRNYLSMLEE